MDRASSSPCSDSVGEVVEAGPVAGTCPLVALVRLVPTGPRGSVTIGIERTTELTALLTPCKIC